jgi:hypothetical protein
MFRQPIYACDAIQVKEYGRTQIVAACRRISLTEIKENLLQYLCYGLQRTVQTNNMKNSLVTEFEG